MNESGATFLAEYRFQAADGSYRWLRDEAVRVHDDEGLPLFWQGVMLDITDQKRAQQDLREADERYRAVVEHIPAVVYTEAPDADPAKFYISPQVTDLFGYTAEEWTWTTDFWRDRIHPDDAETVVAADERSNETLEAYTLDYRFRHRDGHWVWVRDEATFVPELDGEGFWQGFMLDITERKRRRGPAPGGRAEVPHDRRAEPGDLLHPGHRSRRSGGLAHHLHRARQHRDARLHAGGHPGRPDAVAGDHPPRRPGAGARSRRREQHWRRATPPSRWNTG